ncbi:MAG: hypothetical protein QNK37_38075 [Acidobacteriota bacterium]|nr:hypothetical protein [Acidobacteriota bacterium]
MEISALSSQDLLGNLNSATAPQETEAASTEEETTSEAQSDEDSVEVSEEAELLNQLQGALPTLLTAETDASLLGTIGGSQDSSNSDINSLLQTATFASSDAQLATLDLSGNSEAANPEADAALAQNNSLLNILG